MPEVVSVRKANLRKRGYEDFQDWNSLSENLYIGRNLSFYVPGTFSSRWRNPFNAKKHGREECLRLFEEYIRNSETLWRDLEELEDKKELGCWCKPQSCHGDVLLRLLEEKKNAYEEGSGVLN